VSEHPARPDWRLAKGAKSGEEKAPSIPLPVEVASKRAIRCRLRKCGSLSTSFALANLNESRWRVRETGTIKGEMREGLKENHRAEGVVAKRKKR